MAKKALRWRQNCIRSWRDLRGMTLEGTAEALSQAPYRINRTHNSLGRIERGEQMPPIELIEALAKLYRTDIDSLLYRRPEAADGGPAPTAKGLLQLWDLADAQERSLMLEIARRVVHERE